MTDLELLAEAMYPGVDETPEYYETVYPPRDLPEGAKVTRFAPSPTGYMHIGNLFSAMIDYLAAKDDGGVFYLRIEDTDKKREVADAVDRILDGLATFGVVPVEGVVGAGRETGAYGPYVQSQRTCIYACYAKDLVKKGLAYPCFCTEDELAAMRAEQEARGVTPGYYGEWAKYRDYSPALAAERVKAGEEFVLRLRSARSDKKIVINDCIKGKLELPANDTDAVLMKKDGIPPYAFAHAVDDHLMRTTHVIRGDEWIASLPLHAEIHFALGFRLPKYAHISPIMKIDGGNKRKLSKRKDPEAGVSYYIEQGYAAGTVEEYLMTLANSDFEEWRRANPDAALTDFRFSFKKMSASGALFDADKLDDIGKNVVARMSAAEVASLVTDWAKEYDPELYALLAADPDKAVGIFSIDRGGAKPRKDMAKWADARAFVAPMYDELFEPAYRLPDGVSADDAAAALAAFAEVYDPADDADVWFGKLKGVCPALGYCPDVKTYKKDPSAYKGHVGSLSAVVRLAVTGRDRTPDLTAIMALLGRQTCLERMKTYAAKIGAVSSDN